MRIVIDQGVYDLRNKGNVALTQTAVRRLGTLWPEATMEVMTSAPHLLRLYCPTVAPIRPDGSSATGGVRDRAFGQLPSPLLRVALEAREALWQRRLPDAEPVSQPGVVPVPAETPVDFIERADLFVVAGAQFMSDACRDDALAVLDRLEAARRFGVPTAMVGQGVGPFDDPELRARARAVYPLVDLVFVRDRLTAPPLLTALGVASQRVVYTGDDAIELAYARRVAELGRDVGVGLRVSPYTLVGAEHVADVRRALWRAGERHDARLRPVPISYSRHEQDERVLRTLVEGPRAAVGLRWRLHGPEAIVDEIGRCRLVVTGAFHTAVFALSQGIPAVGVANSPMYVDKFRSLEDAFGDACQVVILEGGDLEDRLVAAIDTAWARAVSCRATLLSAAARHVALGHEAYGRLRALVADRRR